jgi:hypothetical protein
VNDLVRAKKHREELWEQLETATSWEAIKQLADEIRDITQEIYRLRRKYDLA